MGRRENGLCSVLAFAPLLILADCVQPGRGLINMKIVAPMTILTIIILVPVFIRLALNVIKQRVSHQVAIGSAGHADLEAAIRAHGNFAEYVPLGLVLVLCAEINGAPVWLAGSVALLLVAGRLFHAAAIPSGDLPNRIRGMKLTFASLGLGVIANLVPLVAQMM